MKKSAAPTTPLLKPTEAAVMLGISYPTIKQWILNGRLKTVKTPGGHHRISHSVLKPFLNSSKKDKNADSRVRYTKVSGRNQLAGYITGIEMDRILAKVVLNIGGQRVTAIITADAVREMRLKKGDHVAALVKATEVMIERF